MRIEVIIPKKDIIDADKLMRHIELALDLAATGAKADFNTTTTTWNHRPLFLINRARAGQRIIYTSDVIYKYVNDGTQPHIIPLNISSGTVFGEGSKPLRFFRTGFKPKSRVRYIGSNKGAKATKDLTFAKWVQHPGTEAREFNKEIAEKWEKELPIELQRAIDYAVK